MKLAFKLKSKCSKPDWAWPSITFWCKFRVIVTTWLLNGSPRLQQFSNTFTFCTNISCHFDKYNFQSISFAWLVPLFHQPLQSAVACQTKTFSRLKAAQAFTSGLQPSVRWTTTLYIFIGAYDVCGFVKNIVRFKENYFRIWPKKFRFVLFLILLWGKGLPFLLFLESVDRQLAGERACWQKERHSYSFFWLLWTQYCQPPDNESFPWEYWACGLRLFVSMGEAKKSEKYYFSDCGNTHIFYMFTIHYDRTYSSSFLN